MAKAAKLTRFRENGGFEAIEAELLFNVKNFLVKLENGNCIFSPVYTTGSGEQWTQWRLAVIPSGNDVAAYLELHKSFKSEALTKIEFYILNQNGTKVNYTMGNLFQFTKEAWLPICAWTKFILKSEIVEQEFCHYNGTVTFGCDLTIYHEMEMETKLVKPPKLNFSEQLWELYLDNELTDVTLQVGVTEDIIACHKTVLTVGSAVFKKMFLKKDTLESQTGIVKVQNFNVVVIGKLVEFLYRGKISNFGTVASLISDLLVAADFYHVPELVSLCEYHLLKNLSAENVLLVLCFANKSQNSVLLDRGVEFVIKNPELITTEGYKNFLKFNPKLCLDINTELCKRLGYN